MFQQTLSKENKPTLKSFFAFPFHLLGKQHPAKKPGGW
jgi:hypothetical protein